MMHHCNDLDQKCHQSVGRISNLRHHFLGDDDLAADGEAVGKVAVVDAAAAWEQLHEGATLQHQVAEQRNMLAAVDGDFDHSSDTLLCLAELGSVAHLLLEDIAAAAGEDAVGADDAFRLEPERAAGTDLLRWMLMNQLKVQATSKA